MQNSKPDWFLFLAANVGGVNAMHTHAMAGTTQAHVFGLLSIGFFMCAVYRSFKRFAQTDEEQN